MTARDDYPVTHLYRIRRWGSDRFGQPCQVLGRGRNGNVLVRFSDGHLTVTTRWGIRRIR